MNNTITIYLIGSSVSLYTFWTITTFTKWLGDEGVPTKYNINIQLITLFIGSWLSLAALAIVLLIKWLTKRK